MIIYITGDNGLSFRGGPIERLSSMELSVFNGLPESLDVALENLDKFGGPHIHTFFVSQRMG